MQIQPAYITIVEGPPPEFKETLNNWPSGVLEGPYQNNIAVVEMRAFNGDQLVARCHDAWQNGRPARLKFPLGDGHTGELDIAAARWERVDEGDKLFLWVRLDGNFELEMDLSNFSFDDYFDDDMLDDGDDLDDDFDQDNGYLSMM